MSRAANKTTAKTTGLSGLGDGGARTA